MRMFKSSLLNRKVAGGLTRDVAMKALKLLDQKLGEANRRMALTLIGGGVMLLVHRTRLDTRDLDVIPPGRSDIDLLEKCRDEVTREMKEEGVNLPVAWINAQAAPIFQEQRKYFSSNDFYRVGYLKFPNLDIVVAAPEALLAMKVQALRDPNDWDDVDAICRILKIRSWEQFVEIVEPRVEDMGIIGNDDILRLRGIIASLARA